MKQAICSTLIALAFVGGACDTAPPDPRFGVDLLGIQYDVVSVNEGIHPDNSVLANENNPFRFTELSLEARFDILGSGAAAASFYAWATQLAREPTGESQFYAATSLARVYASSAVVDDDDLETVRRMANLGALSVIENFPGSVTFDATGTVPIALAPRACELLVFLGAGFVSNGELLVVDTFAELPVFVSGCSSRGI